MRGLERWTTGLWIALSALGCGGAAVRADGGADAAAPDGAETGAPAVDADSDAAGPDALVDAGSTDAGSTDAGSGRCETRNAPGELAVRDGFVEVCADPTRHPRAVCGDGTPYRFSYRRATGASAGLLVYFRGGGNCTDYVTCWGTDGMGGAGRTVGTLSNTRTSPEIIPASMRTFGIFDRTDPTALFPDFDVLYLPYCSGDGGLQSTEQTFARPPGASSSAPAMITTYFRGQDNRRAALEWASREFAGASRLVVWGSSAGSYASMGAIPDIAAAWPTAPDVTWWGEGGVGVGRPSYGTMLDDIVTRFDGREGRRLVRFVQFTYASDATQIRFAPAPFFGDEPMFRAETRRLLEARAARSPANYRYVAVPGSCHTLALEPSLYQAVRRVGMVWQPVVPAMRPNPELVFGGQSLVALMRRATRESGVFDGSFSNVAPDGFVGSARCEIISGDAL